MPSTYPLGGPKCLDIIYLHYLFVWLHPSIYVLAVDLRITILCLQVYFEVVPFKSIPTWHCKYARHDLVQVHCCVVMMNWQVVELVAQH